MDTLGFESLMTGFLEAPEIVGEVRRQIRVAGEGRRFAVSIGEPLPPGTPPERVRFFCDATHRRALGRTPSAARLIRHCHCSERDLCWPIVETRAGGRL